MVNLNRQIAVARARAGGFSAHVLPSPVGYQAGPPSWLFRPRKADDNWVVDFSDGEALQFADGEVVGSLYNPAWSLETTDGPHQNAPWLKSRISDSREQGDGTAGSRSIGQDDARFAPAQGALFTCEMWARSAVSGSAKVNSTASVRVRPAGGSHTPFRMAIVAVPDFSLYELSASFFLSGASGTAPNWNGVVRHDNFSSGYLAQWHHYAVVVDQPSNEVRLYADGQRVADTFNNNFSLAGFNDYDWQSVNRSVISHQISVSQTGSFSADVGISFLRFTPSALYTSNFTPPQL